MAIAEEKQLTEKEMEAERQKILGRFQCYERKLKALEEAAKRGSVYLSSNVAWQYRGTMRTFRDSERATTNNLIFFAYVESIVEYEKVIDEAYSKYFASLSPQDKLKAKIFSFLLI